MSAPAFTPGPWLADPMVPEAKRGFYIVAAPDGNNSARDVATVGPTLSPRAEANARLIAAAPELYASAEETHAWVRRIQDVMTGYLVPDGYDADEALSKLIEMLDGPEQREIQGRAFSALARAKGGVDGHP